MRRNFHDVISNFKQALKEIKMKVNIEGKNHTAATP